MRKVKKFFRERYGIIVLIIAFSFLFKSMTHRPPEAQGFLAGTFEGAVLHSQFTQASIRVDGIADPEWSKAEPSRIGIAMVSNLSSTSGSCNTYAEVRSMWDGALLYILVNVHDTDVTTAGKRVTDRDGVEIYLDLYNDKFPKYEEDDGIIRVTADGELSGSGVYADRLKAYAVKSNTGGDGTVKGYAVELALATGGIPAVNGTLVGMDFGITGAVSQTNTARCRVFWSSGNNRWLDDNSMWGTVVLNGYDGKVKKALDTYMLQENIKRAESLPRGIWRSESDLDKSLGKAKEALSATDQRKIDKANTTLEKALNGLRRSGKYADPYDLPAINYLPDPFKFINGKRVVSPAGWQSRAAEIKDLAQYYEYGYMPEPPEKVTASAEGSALTVSIEDSGKEASFDARLTIPTEGQCGKSGPYPAIISIDFRAMPGNDIYLKEGYAVLSFTYTSVASDNFQHMGAFYTLYPYDVRTGRDVGTLMAWAWGASRAVDALGYLAKNDPSMARSLDLNKLVVTGFSRCGKAALAAGLMDERFGVVNPGASGCGGAAVYRYDSYGNTPARIAPFGNVYAWGTSTGCEVLGDRIRHQGHNSNEMLARVLNPGRMYKTTTHGYGERLPYDHHEILAAIAPRAVILTNADNDYANAAEGDCASLEGARPVFRFLGVDQNLALNIRRSEKENQPGFGGGHRLDQNQMQNLVEFSDMIFYDKPMPEELKTLFYTNPYLPAFDKYYGGIKSMMPWLDSVPE